MEGDKWLLLGFLECGEISTTLYANLSVKCPIQLIATRPGWHSRAEQLLFEIYNRVSCVCMSVCLSVVMCLLAFRTNSHHQIFWYEKKKILFNVTSSKVTTRQISLNQTCTQVISFSNKIFGVLIHFTPSRTRPTAQAKPTNSDPFPN